MTGHTPLHVVLLTTLAGGVLLTAAGLKLAAGPTEGWGLWPHRALVVAEIMLGLGLLSGLRRRAVALVACGCFAVFAVVNVVHLSNGRASCGCFGAVVVPPWASLLLDVVLAAALAWSAATSPTVPVGRPRTRVAITAGLAVIAAAFVFRPRPPPPPPTPMASPAELGTVSGKLIVLAPEAWPGRPFALADFVPDGASLKSGRWVVLLYHNGCSTCAKALPAFEHALARPEAGFSDSMRPKSALIEVPPHDDGGLGAWGDMKTTLPMRYDWFVTTPVAVAVENGVVKAAVTGETAIDAAAFLRRAGFMP